jgi:YVTN family beta-propeller protein
VNRWGLVLAAVTELAAPAGADPEPRDRVYAAEQFSNTVSVIDPATNALLGLIRLGDPQPTNFSPLYRGQVLVHGLGASPDHRLLAVVSIGSNSVTFIATASNAVIHTTYVGRSPHEATFAPNGREVWVTVRGEDYVSVIDTTTFAETAQVKVPNGPGMVAFSPDGQLAYVCSSFTPETVVVRTSDRSVVGRVEQASPFCPNLAVSPDGAQVWLTLKDTGKTMVVNAQPPFDVLATVDTGPITNHVNFAGAFAYVTVGGESAVKVVRRQDFVIVATIPVGKMPHGVWPSGDGKRVYVGLENDDAMVAIDTATRRVVGTVPIGQAPQAIAYVPDASSSTANLEPLGLAGRATHLELEQVSDHRVMTSVVLFDQGLTQVLQASVTGLEPAHAYVLGLAESSTAVIEPLASFTANSAGAAIVNATGPIRPNGRNAPEGTRRRIVIAPMSGSAIQISR